MKLTMTLQAIDPITNENVNRSMGNINTMFVDYSNGVDNTLPTPPFQIDVAKPYSSFMAWVNAVARGLNSLSDNTYRNASVAATWDVMAETEG